MTATNQWPPSNYVRADPAFIKVQRFSWTMSIVVLLALALVPAVLRIFFNVPLWVVIAPVVLVALYGVLSLRIVKRRVAALSYFEGAKDLSVTSGVMWRKHIVVPYGRMQYVELTSGPVERRYGLCRLTLNTAESSATAHVLGLPAAVGEQLRERLVAAGEEQAL